MSYDKKQWKNRQTEFPGRRRLTPVVGEENVYDIDRHEGMIYDDGHPYNSDEMNDLEARIERAFAIANEELTALGKNTNNTIEKLKSDLLETLNTAKTELKNYTNSKRPRVIQKTLAPNNWATTKQNGVTIFRQALNVGIAANEQADFSASAYIKSFLFYDITPFVSGGQLFAETPLVKPTQNIPIQITITETR